MEEKLMEGVHVGTAACDRASHRSTQMQRPRKRLEKGIERNRAPSSRLQKSVDSLSREVWERRKENQITEFCIHGMGSGSTLIKWYCKWCILTPTQCLGVFSLESSGGSVFSLTSVLTHKPSQASSASYCKPALIKVY